jgi:hypothetical protein
MNLINKISHPGAIKRIKSKTSEQWKIIDAVIHGDTQ